MHRNLVVTETDEFKGCVPSSGIRMRVAGTMSIRELRCRFGHFAACVNGQRVLLGMDMDTCISDVVAFEEELSIFVYPGKRSA